MPASSHFAFATVVTAAAATVLLSTFAACRSPRSADSAGNSTCGTLSDAPRPLPGTRAEDRRVAAWIEASKRYGNVDRALLSPARQRARQAAQQAPKSPARLPFNPVKPGDLSELERSLKERHSYVRSSVRAGTYRDAKGQRLAERTVSNARMAIIPRGPAQLHMAHGPVPLRCIPLSSSLHTRGAYKRLDRNHCSTARIHEVLRVWPEEVNGHRLAMVPYGFGWIPSDARLSPPLPNHPGLRRAIQGPPTHRLRSQLGKGPRGEAPLAAKTPVYLASEDKNSAKIARAFEGGLSTETAVKRSDLEAIPLPFTRRNVLREAFRYLNTPYGWGGQDSGLDCSRFVMQVLAPFGVRLPRTSALQAEAGSFRIALPSELGRNERLWTMEQALRQGIVLARFPGHIALYLGRNSRGVPMMIHAFADYLEACGKTGKADSDPSAAALHRSVMRVAVSTLELGAGSPKGSYLERFTELIVFGKGPGPTLQGIATARATAPVESVGRSACPRSSAERGKLWVLPQRPQPGQGLRLALLARHHPGPHRLLLTPWSDDLGATSIEAAQTLRTGPYPWGSIGAFDAVAAGRYWAAAVDGPRVVACARVEVGGAKGGNGAQLPQSAATSGWTATAEDLYAVFVEQLFREPDDEEATWQSLHELLREPKRNLLHSYLGLAREESLSLVPDCADLPYYLRAYVAFKLGLPMSFHRCDRGRADRAARCSERVALALRAERRPAPGPGVSPQRLPKRAQAQPSQPSSSLRGFAAALKTLRNGVHSGSARTAAKAEASDLYPVALTRAALRPGTVYADPYGHLLVLTRWLPQGFNRAGVLLAADAQPDGTVGRRRFSRGSFLHDPKAPERSAGFKAWRPWVRRRAEEPAPALELLDNAALRNSPHWPLWSAEAGTLSKRQFYARVEALINPRPLPAAAVLKARIEAFDQAARRRIVSVENAEDYIRQGGSTPIAMPSGYRIFETTGPWEDYASPARDMRLLIVLDSVLEAPIELAQRTAETNPQQAALEATLAKLLKQRRIAYRRSDGQTQELSLYELSKRAKRLEMAYNPNDCPEVRWGAPTGSHEMRSCSRRAPADQRAKMKRYQTWFAERSRPPRGTRR